MSSSSCLSTSALDGMGRSGTGSSVRENTGVGAADLRLEFFLVRPFPGGPGDEGLEPPDSGSGTARLVNSEGLSLFLTYRVG